MFSSPAAVPTTAVAAAAPGLVGTHRSMFVDHNVEYAAAAAAADTPSLARHARYQIRRDTPAAAAVAPPIAVVRAGRSNIPRQKRYITSNRNAEGLHEKITPTYTHTLRDNNHNHEDWGTAVHGTHRKLKEAA